ncbi:hypothetical protein B0T26DRAFT_709378 [Lasiosphaeria miniovina]|uniref:Uncharacterized protein n=1 Tax=Lasiosphaeria miniovina TaxID=1954250 RepID=A0AA40DZL2_9PEZI|nr:uncharacterized protein B0T26DRAFT_709378 [Lasiosphaeria miniovina]KAK0717273.1 hypothetical protein B0T26DRAFT_709378 [Lasiosphaeria miniovina]
MQWGRLFTWLRSGDAANAESLHSTTTKITTKATTTTATKATTKTATRPNATAVPQAIPSLDLAWEPVRDYLSALFPHAAETLENESHTESYHVVFLPRELTKDEVAEILELRG